MTGGQGGASELDRWLDAFSRVYASPDRLSREPCPSCGAGDLRLRYVAAPSFAADVAMPAFWCGTCLRGPLLCTTTVPPGATRHLTGEVDVPSYRIVPAP